MEHVCFLAQLPDPSSYQIINSSNKSNLKLVGEIYPGYYGPLVMAQNSGYGRFHPVVNGWGTIHPIPGNDPTTPSWRGGATNLKRTILGNNLHHHFSNLRLAWVDGISPPVYLSCLSRQPGEGTQAPGQTFLGHPTADSHRLLWASGSGRLRCLARRDTAVGTHAHLSVSTRVWNPFHHCLA
jgi:hypothetical protein